MYVAWHMAVEVSEILPTDIQEKLLGLQDLRYRNFHSRLLPTLAKEKIIGIRMPVLRKFAKSLSNVAKADFLQQLPHQYYEENNLHGLLIMQSKDYGSCMRELERFLPYIDNWATCDMLRPKILRQHLADLSVHIDEWLQSGETYTVRLAIGFLLSFCLEDDVFKSEHLAKVAAIQTDEYYVRMMAAWYFATALVKQYDAALPYMSKEKLDEWTRRKAIQKAVESYRISPKIKDYLRSLR